MGADTDCRACKHCYLDDDFICGHEACGTFGRLTHIARSATQGTRGEGHCGPGATRFEQHPLRGPNGELYPAKESA